MIIFLFIVGISLLILIHELGHFLAAKWFGLLVHEFGIGFPPRLFGKKIGETLYSVNALPFGGFVRIHGEKPEYEKEKLIPERSFAYRKIWKRALIIGAGVIMNFVLGWAVISMVFMIGTPTAIFITHVGENTPAREAGLMAGDAVLGFETSDAFTSFIAEGKGKEISLTILRGGEEIEILTTPRLTHPKDEGALGIGFTEAGQERLGFFQSISAGFMTSVTMIAAICIALFNLLVGIFTGGAALEGFVGPVGIFQVANQTAQFGLVYLLQLIGLISLNLAVLNILPIPALDGGRLMFLLIEKIKGSPISAKREMVINATGFIILLLLMVLITARDVIQLF
jgi:regulator of sigma E protease